VVLRAGLDTVAERKRNPYPFWELNSGYPARNLAIKLTELFRLQYILTNILTKKFFK
jgi:hypothetical protein